MKKEKRHSIAVFTFCAILLCALLYGCATGRPDVTQTPAGNKLPELTINDIEIGVGDSIEITVFKQDDLKRVAKIDRTGRMMFPLIGDVTVVGKGVLELRQELTDKLSLYFVDPQVTIAITSLQSQKYTILGEVTSPGMFALETNLSLTEALLKAGGMTKDAKDSDIRLIRKNPDGKAVFISMDFDKYTSGDLSQDIPMQNGDIVFVPSLAISDLSWYMSKIGSIISPIVTAETGIVLYPDVKNVLTGKPKSSSNTIVAQ